MNASILPFPDACRFSPSLPSGAFLVVLIYTLGSVLDMILGSTAFLLPEMELCCLVYYEITGWCSLGLHKDMDQCSDSDKCCYNIQLFWFLSLSAKIGALIFTYVFKL